MVKDEEYIFIPSQETTQEANYSGQHYCKKKRKFKTNFVPISLTSMA